jgi:hypothetical protein
MQLKLSPRNHLFPTDFHKIKLGEYKNKLDLFFKICMIQYEWRRVSKGDNCLMLWSHQLCLEFFFLCSVKTRGDCSFCWNRSFNIFQVYQYFTIYRRCFFLKFEHFAWISYLKLGGTNHHFKWVKVSSTTPYWKACDIGGIYDNYCLNFLFIRNMFNNYFQVFHNLYNKDEM